MTAAYALIISGLLLLPSVQIILPLLKPVIATATIMVMRPPHRMAKRAGRL